MVRAAADVFDGAMRVSIDKAPDDDINRKRSACAGSVRMGSSKPKRKACFDLKHEFLDRGQMPGHMPFSKSLIQAT